MKKNIFKVLKYKKNDEWFGNIDQNKHSASIYLSEVPELFDLTTTEEVLKMLYKDTKAYEQLSLYELVTIRTELTI
jgi:hypothetical protein